MTKEFKFYASDTGKETLLFGDDGAAKSFDVGYVRCPRCMWKHACTIPDFDMRFICDKCDQKFEIKYNDSFKTHEVVEAKVKNA